jgi:hypothetical protein
MMFKRLSVKVISSNKVLGLMGQDFPLPQVGHSFSEEQWDIRDAIVLIVSHSGGTFGPLAVSNLLQASSSNIFVVASEWDTQIGKQLRALPQGVFESRVFSTNLGVRPAEPCSISVVATHHLLTLILTYIAHTICTNAELRHASGCVINETTVRELERCSSEGIGCVEAIVGVDRDGRDAPTATSRELEARGRVWADHVLEAPRAWALAAVYVLVTVSLGVLPVTHLASRVGGDTTADATMWQWRYHLPRVLDALVYVWLAEIMTAVLRVVQGRPLFHRMGGRTVVIGDVPWGGAVGPRLSSPSASPCS